MDSFVLTEFDKGTGVSKISGSVLSVFSFGFCDMADYNTAEYIAVRFQEHKNHKAYSLKAWNIDAFVIMTFVVITHGFLYALFSPFPCV